MESFWIAGEIGAEKIRQAEDDLRVAPAGLDERGGDAQGHRNIESGDVLVESSNVGPRVSLFQAIMS